MREQRESLRLPLHYYTLQGRPEQICLAVKAGSRDDTKRKMTNVTRSCKLQ